MQEVYDEVKNEKNTSRRIVLAFVYRIDNASADVYVYMMCNCAFYLKLIFEYSSLRPPILEI